MLVVQYLTSCGLLIEEYRRVSRAHYFLH